MNSFSLWACSRGHIGASALRLLPVHREHVIELDEVAADDLPAAQPAQVVAAPRRGLLRPQVGRVADVDSRASRPNRPGSGPPVRPAATLCRNIPSALGDRQILPVQTNST